MSYVTEELEDELGRIKTALENRSVITVKAINHKMVLLSKQLKAKVDCSSLMKDDLANSLFKSNIRMLGPVYLEIGLPCF